MRTNLQYCCNTDSNIFSWRLGSFLGPVFEYVCAFFDAMRRPVVQEQLITKIILFMTIGVHTQDDDWDALPMSNAPAAAPAATFGDDDFGGGGFGDAPVAAAPAPAGGFEGFAEEAPAADTAGFGGDTGFGGGDTGFGGDDGFGSAAAPEPAAPVSFDVSGGNELLSSVPAPTPAPAPPKKSSMFSNAPVVDNCETTALE